MKCIVILSQKKACWIWIAVDRHRKRFINCVVGTRGTKTGMLLWNNIKGLVKKSVMTDYWQVYEQIIPTEQHVQSKAETYTVEGYNSLFRHFLARMRRKTKCYSKCIKMLYYSAKLLMAKWNNTLAIVN